jgi:hypothetical protein
MKIKSYLASLITVVGLVFMFVCSHALAQSVTKVLDMNWAAGGGGGSFGPKGRLVPVGTNYWFLTENGGVFGFGGAFSFDPVANTQSEISSFGLDANTPYGSITKLGSPQREAVRGTRELYLTSIQIHRARRRQFSAFQTIIIRPGKRTVEILPGAHHYSSGMNFGCFLL